MILTGSPWRVTWVMAWPAIAVMMLFGLNAVMDAVYIGQLIGEQALAGTVLAYPVTQLTLGLGSLAGIGGGVALSIAIGRGDRDLMRCLPGTVLAIAGLLALGYAVVGGVLAETWSAAWARAANSCPSPPATCALRPWADWAPSPG